MRWRSVLFVVIWVAAILLLVFPSLCPMCGQSTVPVVIVLGMIGTVVAMSDARQVKRMARERLLGGGEDAEDPSSKRRE